MDNTFPPSGSLAPGSNPVRLYTLSMRLLFSPAAPLLPSRAWEVVRSVEGSGLPKFNDSLQVACLPTPAKHWGSTLYPFLVHQFANGLVRPTLPLAPCFPPVRSTPSSPAHSCRLQLPPSDRTSVSLAVKEGRGGGGSRLAQTADAAFMVSTGSR